MPLGRHLLLDVRDVDPTLLNAPDALRRRIVRVARAAGATVVGSRFRRFAPQGITGVVLLAESHVTVHTWPELGFAAFDVFTCGDGGLSARVADGLRATFRGTMTVRADVERGP